MPRKNTELIEIISGVFLTLFGGAFLIKLISSFNSTLQNILGIIIFAALLIMGLLLLGDALKK